MRFSEIGPENRLEEFQSLLSSLIAADPTLITDPLYKMILESCAMNVIGDHGVLNITGGALL